MKETYKVQIARTMQDLEEAKALDDLAFGSHLGVTMEELVQIQHHGAVLLLRDTEGTLIGESQVITESIPQHDHMTPDQAYNYGTAIRPGLQSEGLAQALFQAQEMVAREAGKTRATLTVRLENGRSIRGRLKAGYRITGYNPEEYGPFDAGGARLIMEKDFSREVPPFVPTAFVGKFQTGSIVLVNPDSFHEIIRYQPPIVALKVKTGDEIDRDAHPLVGEVMKKYYVGIGLLKPDEYGDPARSLLIFAK